MGRIGIKKGGHCHFIGIGGIAMAQVALLMQEMGYKVSGSDAAIHPPSDRLLEDGGIRVCIGYNPANLVPAPDLVVIGNAVSRQNPEVEALLAAGVPYTSLPGLIEELILDKGRVAVVAGTHGKTTTTSLLAWLLTAGGLDPTFLVGGVPINFGSGYRLGKGVWIILEGDEYDSAFFDKRPKFLHYRPHLVILTGIEYDHADIYQDLEAVKGAFGRLIPLIPPDGHLIAKGDDTTVMQVVDSRSCTFESYGASCDWSARKIMSHAQGTIFSLYHKGKSLGEFEIPLWGWHNVWNAIAAIAAASHIGLSIRQIKEGLVSFRGVRRRMEVVGEEAGVTVIDDFAHHPTAIKETLRGVRLRFPGARLWGIFEPRSQTMRCSLFQGELATALAEADEVVIGGLYAPPAKGEALDPAAVAEEVSFIKGNKCAIYLQDPAEIISHVFAHAASGDVVVVMSSGHFAGLPRRICAALQAKSGLADSVSAKPSLSSGSKPGTMDSE